MARIKLYPNAEHFKRLHSILEEMRDRLGLDTFEPDPDCKLEELITDIVDNTFNTTKMIYSIDEESLE